MSKQKDSDDDDNNNVYGPVLPANFLKSKNDEKSKSNINNEDNDDDDENDDEVYGPILPSSSSSVIGPVIGPSLPINFNSSKQLNEHNNNNNADVDDDDFIIGPLPPGEIDLNHIHNQNRSIRNETDGPKREKWMLEPGKSLGRAFQVPTKSITKFSQKTPKDKRLTEDEKMEIHAKAQKDKKMEEFLEKYDKTNKREQSLMEIHRQDLRKNKVSCF